MKDKFLLRSKNMMIFLLFFIITSTTAQTIQINQNFEKDTLIFPFSGIEKAYSFKISGGVILNNDTSLVRVIVEDTYGNRLLIYETYSLISANDTVTITNNCDETCFLDGTSPASLIVDIVDASFMFDSLLLGTEPIENAIELQVSSKYNIDSIKISNLNTNLIKHSMYWRADRNNITGWEYQKKEEFFGRKYNLLGFDYYKGGVFERISRRSYSKESSQYVNSFDWRNRHGANNYLSPYYDGDSHLTGWVTPVKAQGVCSTCYIFATTGAIEARYNLYYNIHNRNYPNHLDYDISEQDVWKCGYGLTLNNPCSSGGLASYAYDRIISHYRCTENHYMYDPAATGDCQKIGDPDGEIKISGRDHITNINYNQDQFKMRLIKDGPVTGGLPFFVSSSHYVVITGYETGITGLKLYSKRSESDSDIILKASSELIGTTICLFKNSWSENWGEDGFGMLPITEFTNIEYTSGPLLLEGLDHNPNSPTTDIICSDEDGDGYYWWGISQDTPCASCPNGISTTKDCDDSNRDLGPYDASYGCTSNCETETGTFTAPNNYLVSSNLRIKKDILINTGCTVTINSTLFMSPGKKILIKKGGKLIIQSQGKITSGCNQLWKGIEIEGTSLPQNYTNQGVCIIYSGGIIENAICGIKSLAENFQNGSGAIINADNAIFRNNKTALYLTRYSSSFDPSLTKINNCTFETTEVLLDGSSPLELVRLDDLSNANCIAFKGCIFTQSGNKRLATGIKAFNSYFKCIKNNSVPTTFDSLLYGVYGSCSTSPSPVIIIDDCDFNNNIKGIYLSALTAPEVTRNRMNIPTINSGFMPIDGFSSYGLYLDASTAYKVEGNDFFCSSYTDQIPVYIRTCGIYIRNSGPYANEVYSNIFTSLNCGVAAFGVNRNGNNEGLQIKCNTFNDCGIDIGVYRGTLPLTSNIGLRRDQGEYNTSDPSKSAGNVFTSLSFLHHSKDIDNSGGNILRYNHHVRTSIPINLRMIPESTISPNVEVHHNLSSYYSSILSCPSGLQSSINSLSFLIQEADSLKEMIDSTSIVLQQNIDGGDTPGTVSLVSTSPTNENNAVYNDLIIKSPYLSDTTMKIAVQREELLTPYMLRDILVANPHSAKSDTIYNALENRYTPLNDTIMGEILTNSVFVGAKEQMEISRAELRYQWGKTRNNIIAQLLSDTTQLKTDSIIAFYNTSTLTDKYSLAFLFASDGNYLSAEQVLGSINTNELNLVQLTEYLLQNDWINFINDAIEHDNIISVDSSQISMLYQILSNDSAYNSTASVFARNELMKAGYLTYIEPLLFNSHQKSHKMRKHYPLIRHKENYRYLKVTPNPANDFINVQWRLSRNCNQGLIMITSLDGTILKKVKVSVNQDEIKLSLTNIKTNQVIVTLMDCSSGASSSKLIIK